VCLQKSGFVYQSVYRASTARILKKNAIFCKIPQFFAMAAALVLKKADPPSLATGTTNQTWGNVAVILSRIIRLYWFVKGIEVSHFWITEK
jgi:hypothetical protein